MHSSTPLLINRFRNFSERWSKSVKGGVLFALTIHEEGGGFQGESRLTFSGLRRSARGLTPRNGICAE
jgi:hypothetical protein